MRLISFLITVITFFCGCGKIGCRPASHHYTFITGRQIDTAKSTQPDPDFEYYTYQINSGTNIVFNYTYNFKDCPNIADDEGMRTVVFEIPANATNFAFADSTGLRQAKALLRLSCECIPYQPIFFKQGFIEGQKINNKEWRIKATLQQPGSNSTTITFNKVFLKS